VPNRLIGWLPPGALDIHCARPRPDFTTGQRRFGHLSTLFQEARDCPDLSIVFTLDALHVVHPFPATRSYQIVTNIDVQCAAHRRLAANLTTVSSPPHLFLCPFDFDPTAQMDPLNRSGTFESGVSDLL
jgi:hypothetical protein